MLPFIKQTKEGAIAGPTEAIKREPDEESGSDYDMLESAAEDLISAIHKKDVKSACQALRAAFQICDSEPHEEGPHE